MKILAAILVLFFVYNINFAHSCMSYAQISEKELASKLDKVPAIFYGEVVFIGERMSNQDEFKNGSQVIKVKVLQAWKGIEMPEVSILYTRTYTTFEQEIGGVGTKKIFYAYKYAEDSNLHIDSCSFTAFNDDRMKNLYGAGKSFEQVPENRMLSNEQTEKSQGFFANLWQSIKSFFS